MSVLFLNCRTTGVSQVSAFATFNAEQVVHWLKDCLCPVYGNMRACEASLASPEPSNDVR